jgi:hypothetical protein
VVSFRVLLAPREVEVYRLGANGGNPNQRTEGREQKAKKRRKSRSRSTSQKRSKNEIKKRSRNPRTTFDRS